MICRIFLLTVIFAAIACNGSESSESHDARKAAETAPKTLEDSLYEAVEEGHDIGMAKYGKLKRALTEIQHALDSLNKLPAKKLDKEYQQSLIDLQEDLNYAQYGMDTWMTEFKADSLKDNKELRIKYLQSEKDKVTKVRDNILNGLQRADSLLKR
jgi:hypothetical protein